MTTNYLAFYDGLKTCRDARLPFIAETLQAALPHRQPCPQEPAAYPQRSTPAWKAGSSK